MDISFDRRILVIGDIMLDRYVEAEVGRISPEAPVPIANVKRRWSTAGGAANVARNLACLGCSVTLCGARGRDKNGQELQELLEHDGIMAPTSYFDDRPTTCKCRILASNQQLLRLDEEVTASFDQAVYERLFTNCEHALSWAEGVILSDYGKGVFNRGSQGESLVRKIISVCHEKNIPCCVDPRGTDWACYSGADCLTPNTKELNAALGGSSNYEDLIAKARVFMKELSIPRILLTRGPLGMTLIEQEGSLCEIEAVRREVSDVSGAGDTVISVLLASVANKMDWVSAARLSNTAAGIVVDKVGTSPIHLDELLSQLASDKNALTPAISTLRSKLVSRQTLMEKVSAWKEQKKKIVFTNGCFDLLHPGHIKLLQEAAQQGDHLIVALNSDDSVRRLKGSDRPIQSQDARALVMAGIAGVDCVVIFGEDTPFELVRMIMPDVLVKGGDYKVSDIVGADIVLASGGRVHIVNLVDGFSTSGLVSAISS